MRKKKLKNIEMTKLERNDKIFHIDLPLKKSLLSHVEDFYFLLKQRKGKQEVKLQSSIKMKKRDFLICELVVPPPSCLDSEFGEEIWDLYLVENERKTRVKSRHNDYSLLTVLLPEEKKLFYPYTTIKSNLSFVVCDYRLFANFKRIAMLEDGFAFEGYYYYPPMLGNETIKLISSNLIVTNSRNDEIAKIPLTQIERHNERMKHTEFEGVFKIEKDIDYTLKTSYKFYFEMTYENNGVIETIQSPRMRWIQEKRKHIKKVIRSKARKVLLHAFPTKKSSYFSFQVSNYLFKKEVINGARSKWIQFRRSNLVQEIYRNAFIILGKLPKKNVVMFESFHGKQFSCSPRAIYEQMKKSNINYEMYWSVDRSQMKFFENFDVTPVRRFSLKWLLLMARARYWVTNARLPLWLPKPKGTVYLQTWHGTPLKKLGVDIDEVHMPGTNTDKYKENFLKESSKWDYLISPNAYSTEIFRRAFGFEKTVIESGYPRNDFLINQNNHETIQAIKEKCQLPLDKKVILYAPTWRDNQFYEKGKYKFHLQLDFDKMKKELGDEYVILLRLHYLVAENLNLSGYEDFVYDFSKHEDIRELYLISDLLITDYSSVFFDYANLKRPMFFFVYDMEDYRDNLRGFYFDFENNAPGPLVKTTDELLAEIKNIDENGFSPSEKIEEFYSKFCYLEDGNASERVVKEVFK